MLHQLLIIWIYETKPVIPFRKDQVDSYVQSSTLHYV